MTHLDNDQDSPYHGITKPRFEKDPFDHDYYDFIDIVDGDLKKSGAIADRPSASNAPDNSWYEATDENLIYRNDPSNGWVVIGHGDSNNSVPGTSYFESLSVTNGDIDLNGNELVNTWGIDFLDRSGNGDQFTVYEDSTSGALKFRRIGSSVNSTRLLLHDGGNVEIPNGNLDFRGTHSITRNGVERIKLFSSNTDLNITNSGGLVKVRDRINSQDVLVANESGNVEIPNGEVTISGNKALRETGGTTDPALAFGTWRTPNSNRPVEAHLELYVESDGTSKAKILVDVDESGGTTADYTHTVQYTVAGSINSARTLYLPPGASYQVRNSSDPQGTNSITVHREVVK